MPGRIRCQLGSGNSVNRVVAHSHLGGFSRKKLKTTEPWQGKPFLFEPGTPPEYDDDLSTDDLQVSDNRRRSMTLKLASQEADYDPVCPHCEKTLSEIHWRQVELVPTILSAYDRFGLPFHLKDRA